MNFDLGENLGEIALVVMVILAGILFVNTTGNSVEKTNLTYPMQEPVNVESPRGKPLFLYEGEKKVPPNPFLMEKEEISHNLPRPRGLELQGIIKKEKDLLIIIRSKEGIFLLKEGEVFLDWEIIEANSGYVILKKNPEKSFFYLPLGGD